MDVKYPINQRVRELIKDLGFTKVDPFYKEYFGEDARSERLRTVFKDENLIKTDFLVELMGKIAEKSGKNPDLNWVFTGSGNKFLDENITSVHMRTDNNEKPLGAEASRIYKELYEKFLGDNSQYLVIHRDVLREHRLVAVGQLEKEKQQAENAQKEIAERMKQIERLTDLIEIAASRPINIQLTYPERAQKDA